MAIRIITDSASDITQEEARTWGFRYCPFGLFSVKRNF